MEEEGGEGEEEEEEEGGQKCEKKRVGRRKEWGEKKETLTPVSCPRQQKARTAQHKPGSTCDHLLFMCGHSTHSANISEYYCEPDTVWRLKSEVSTQVKPGLSGINAWTKLMCKTLHCTKKGDHGPYAQITQSWSVDTKPTQGKLNWQSNIQIECVENNRQERN